MNVHETSESYDDWIVPRLVGIAKRLYQNHGDLVGLIGITEPTRRIGARLYQKPGHCTATARLASALKHFCSETVTYYQNDNGRSSAKDIGIMMNMLDIFDIFDISFPVPDIDINWTWARKLQMVRLRHNYSNLKLRFYCAHFSPGQSSEGKKKRRSQAKRLVKIVRSFTTKDDALPPIIVGDFNAKRIYDQAAEDSVEIMEQYFRRPLDDVADQNGLDRTLIDVVWVGRREKFKHITHDFCTVELKRVDIVDVQQDAYQRDYAVLTEDGFPKSPLSDHRIAEGLLLRIVPI